MLNTSNRFIFGFFAVFLCILLVMFVMFALMVHYDPDSQAGEALPGDSDESPRQPDRKQVDYHDLTPLYRANLFAIDLCLIVMAEMLLIILFVKFTMPATAVATFLILLTTFKAGDVLRRKAASGVLSRLVTNRYATLSHTDMLLLMILSGLIISFAVGVILKQTAENIQPQATSKPTPPSDPVEISG
jgi:hypothetical protein